MVLSSENVYIRFASESYEYVDIIWIGEMWFFSYFRDCLSGTIENCDAPQVPCPYKDDDYSCDMKLLDREIKSVSTVT